MRRIVSFLALLLASAQSPAQEAVPPSCEALPRYQQLDFWLGEWQVYVGTQLVGHNRIEKILDGCALLEHWSAASGGEGKSLFYVDDRGRWQQVWVTGTATAPGGVKEKSWQADAPEGAVRFQGRITAADGRSWLDRTTLTPLSDGGVRQHIEISTDGGVSWQTTFDAEYRRR